MEEFKKKDVITLFSGWILPAGKNMLKRDPERVGKE